MKHNVLKKITKGYVTITKPIKNKVIQPTQQVFTSDVVKNVINPSKSVVNDTIQQTNKNLTNSNSNMDKFFNNKKMWHHVGKTIEKDTNKTVKVIGKGTQAVYDDIKGLTKEGLGVLKSPYMIILVGGVLVIGVIVVTSKK